MSNFSQVVLVIWCFFSNRFLKEVSWGYYTLGLEGGCSLTVLFICEYQHEYMLGRIKVGLQLWACETQFTLVSFINYCIIFQTNNCKTTFAPPCIKLLAHIFFLFIVLSMHSCFHGVNYCFCKCGQSSISPLSALYFFPLFTNEFLVFFFKV